MARGNSGCVVMTNMTNDTERRKSSITNKKMKEWFYTGGLISPVGFTQTLPFSKVISNETT